MISRTVDEYLKLPYTIEVVRYESGDEPGYVARVMELPGCMTQADSFEELGEMLDEAMRLWIEVALEDGKEVPEPRAEEEYSGKFVVRLPKSLHMKLAGAAQRDSVSLNTLVNAALAEFVGERASANANDVQASVPAVQYAPSWQHLSSGARKALLIAGYEEEANRIDERFFADWLSGELRQMNAALEGDYVPDALHHADSLRQALSVCRVGSPLMEVFHESICTMTSLVENYRDLRSGIIKQHLVQGSIRRQVRTQAEPFEIRNTTTGTRILKMLDEDLEYESQYVTVRD